VSWNWCCVSRLSATGTAAVVVVVGGGGGGGGAVVAVAGGVGVCDDRRHVSALGTCVP
jgi:hypothetical protein